MTLRARVLVLLFAAGLAPGGAHAQDRTAPPIVFGSPDPYFVDVLGFAALHPGPTRVDVFVQVPCERLSFVRTEEGYRASYELTITLQDSAGSLVAERTWTEEVRVPTFDRTASSQSSSLTQRSFDVAGGIYTVTTVVRDQETDVPQQMTRRIRVRGFPPGETALSDLMLVGRLAEAGGRMTIVPIVSSNVGSVSGAFRVFCEFYRGPGSDSVRFVVSLLDGSGAIVQETETLAVMLPGRNPVFLRVEQETLTPGEYSLRVRAFAHPPGDGLPAAASGRPFVVRWNWLPASAPDLDRAIEQIQYIAREEDYDRIRNAPTAEERQRLFLDFWRARDPNPGTPRNEKMEEHYARVAYANKHFRHYREGWRTDMGMVYIVFGAPSNIDRHPFDMDAKPYEVWSYYDMNQQFVFVDQTGFGDYRLLTPIWEVWQRARK
ncbi:MAG: GWxTD domain-containing protein [Bacteroidota bacterium]